MKRPLAQLLTCVLCVALHAQRITHQFRDVPLAEALKYIQEQTTQHDLIFIYDELEDFRVTTDIRRQSVHDAILQVVGFYPVRVYRSGRHEIYVERTHKTGHHLTGRVTDRQGAPLAFASVALLCPTDSSAVGSGISNENGDFAVPYEPHDGADMLVRASFVGYSTVCQPCRQGAYCTLVLQPETQALNGITVQGLAPMLRRQAGTIIFTPQDIVGAVSATDLLRYAPGIALGDDAISLFGSTGVTLCVNGREQRGDDRQLLQLLRAMAADGVAAIEIQPSPAASHAAAGQAGMVNIVLRQRVGDFIGGTAAYVRTQNEEHGDEASASLVYAKGRLSTSLDVAGLWAHTDYRETSHTPINDRLRRNVADGRIGNRQRSLRWQADYSPSERWDVGTSVALAKGNRGLRVGGIYDYLPKQPHQQDSIESLTNRDEGTTSCAVNLYATQRTGDHGPRLAYSVDYYLMRMDDGRQVGSNFFILNPSTGTFYRSDTTDVYYKNRIDQEIDNYTAKVDADYAGFRMGSQYSFSRSHRQQEFSEGPNYEHNQTDVFRYDEHIWAGYLSYDCRLGPQWTVSAGGRYEYTWTKGDNRSRSTVSRSHYGKFFPSLHIDYTPHAAHTFYCSLSNRIVRPNFITVNPSVVWNDINTYVIGNPDLKPTYLYKATAGYAYKQLLSLDLYYAVQPARITSVMGLASTGEVYRQWNNDVDDTRVGLNALFSYDRLAWLSVALTQGVVFTETRCQTAALHARVQHLGYTGQLRASLFPCRDRRWVVSLQADYTSAEKEVTRELEPRYRMDLGLQYRFWKDRLRLSLDCRNLLASHVRGSENLGHTMMDFDHKTDYRQLRLALTCHWGTRQRQRQRQQGSDEVRERVVNDF